MVYINWKSPRGYTSKGQNLSVNDADTWIIYLKDKYPGFTHWITAD